MKGAESWRLYDGTSISRYSPNVLVEEDMGVRTNGSSIEFLAIQKRNEVLELSTRSAIHDLSAEGENPYEGSH